MFNDVSLFDPRRFVSCKTDIEVANGAPLEATGVGHVGVLRNELMVPQFTTNLTSVSRLHTDGIDVEFSEQSCCLPNSSTGAVLATAPLVKGVYCFTTPPMGVVVSAPECAAAVLPRPLTAPSKAELWHQRLGHLSYSGLKKLVEGELGIGLNLKVAVVDLEVLVVS